MLSSCRWLTQAAASTQEGRGDEICPPGRALGRAEQDNMMNNPWFCVKCGECAWLPCDCAKPLVKNHDRWMAHLTRAGANDSLGIVARQSAARPMPGEDAPRAVESAGLRLVSPLLD